MISVHDVTLAYRSSPPVLESISARFDPGSMVSFIGSNGAGKTTLLHAIAGLHPPRKGTVELKGRPLYGREAIPLRRRAAEIAVVLSRDSTPGYLQVDETVALGCEARDRAISRRSVDHGERISRALRLCGAESIRSRRVGQLSDGERRRVMIARALAQEPAVLILDEPTAHLDPPHQTEIFRLLHDLVHRGPLELVILATHQLHLALHFSDELVLFLSGTKGATIRQETPERVQQGGLIDSLYPHRDDLAFDGGRGWFVPDDSSRFDS